MTKRNDPPWRNPTGKEVAYDYYLIDLWNFTADPDERACVALLAASERALLWAIPAEWTVISDDGRYVKVRRRRCRLPPRKSH